MAHRMDSDSVLSAHRLSKCLTYIPYYYSRCGRVASWALHEMELGILNFELFSAYACDFEFYIFEF